ncbi:hypothetical protein Pla175_44220 [Pirellulimonas nuda]|uniref:Putative restriction endonuclease domain-containing protein n=1 Tax=Pirellulimonas nuda TaxID=2528009 RepID=A0A518DHQ6_9BACT|nr:Uma2 family endonuclease [Pirellulimonas nuda]QDU91006.1 hypothetical protein Pla175_44220 [Pirellulimonas nuda]
MTAAITIDPVSGATCQGPAPKRFTVAEYHRMAEAGLLEESERFELLGGEIVYMAPPGSDHGAITDRLPKFFLPRLLNRFCLRVQGAVKLSEDSEPNPDFMILTHREDDYRAANPTPEDVLLLVEVAHSSIAFDRSTKLRLYALAGISEYWVADVRRNELIVHQEPNTATGEYSAIKHHSVTQKIAPQAIPDCELDLAWLFR